MGSINLKQTIIATLVCLGAIVAAMPQEASAADSTAPTLHSSSVAPGPIDVSVTPKTISVTLHITDAESGVKAPSVYAFAPGGFNQQHVSAGSSLTSGTLQDGIFTAQLTVPQGVPPGTWQVWVGNPYGYIKDLVGNTNNTRIPSLGSFTVISNAPTDRTAPVISVSSPAEGQHYAQNEVVVSAFSCNDGSGGGVATCAGPSMIDTTTLGSRTFSVSTTDLAANKATKIIHYIVDKVIPPADSVPPTISIANPVPGQHFRLGQIVTSSFSCADTGGSGVAECFGSRVVDTSILGAQTFTVTATDKAGNSASRSVDYFVDSPPGGNFDASTVRVGKTKISLSLTFPGPGRLSIQATTKINGKKLTYASKSGVAKAGKMDFSLTPTLKAKSTLKKLKSGKVTITITFTPEGGIATSKSMTVIVKGGKR